MSVRTMSRFTDRGQVIRPLLTGVFILCFGGGLFVPSEAAAQAEWVGRLDSNRNGYLEPSEISGRARSFFERFAADYNINLSRPNSVRRMEYAARRYMERRDRDGGDDQSPSVGEGVRGFEPDPSLPLVPGFDGVEIKYPYNSDDQQQADELLRRYDRNNDGYLSGREIERVRWSGTPWEESDLNRDGKLSRMELSQRYARERILEERESQMIVRSTTSRTGSSSDQSDTSTRRIDRRSRGGDRGSRRLAYSILQRYDLNKNGYLEPRELDRAGLEIGKADFNRDGKVDLNELAEYLFEEMEREGNDLSELLPTWFFERDLNNDGQIEMSEFTDNWTAERAAEFASYDADGDGIITADELLTAKRVVGGGYVNDQAMVMLPRSIVVSEIQVDEDVKIGELAVQLSITHTYVGQLDGYLIGPDGERIELFAGIGGSDDHFEETIFKDSADRSITRSRAPFRGPHQPGGIAKRQKGLSHFHGQELKGIWQLMVRSSRSDRAGVLHGWSLVVTPDQDSVDRLGE